MIELTKIGFLKNWEKWLVAYLSSLKGGWWSHSDFPHLSHILHFLSSIIFSSPYWKGTQNHTTVDQSSGRNFSLVAKQVTYRFFPSIRNRALASFHPFKYATEIEKWSSHFNMEQEFYSSYSDGSTNKSLSVENKKANSSEQNESNQSWV